MPAALLRPKSRAVRLPGTSGNYISTPDSVLNSITGDIDIRVCVKMANWNTGATQVFLSKRVSNTGYQFRINSTGQFDYVWGNGSADNFIGSVGWVPPANNSIKWLRITHDVDNGAGQNVRVFYYSDDGVTWTLISTNTDTGVAVIADGATPVLLGSDAGTGHVNGTIYYAEVRNGIDGPVVAKFDASQVQATGAATPATINGWTWNGTALYKRDDYVRLPGTAGNYLSFPDSAANSVTGDIELRAKIASDAYISASAQMILSKGGVTDQRSYRCYINANGTIGLALSPDGTTGAGNELSVSSTVVPALSNGIVYYVKVTWRQSDGRVQFFTSSDGTTWAQVGTDRTLAFAQIFDSNSVLEIGSRAIGATERFVGNVYYAEVRNGINGPVVASFNAADNQVQTPWTINGTGWNWEGSSFTGKPVTALSLPGTSGNYVSTPDTAGNSVTGDIDIRVKVSMDDWTPAGANTFVAKFLGAGTSSFIFRNPGTVSTLQFIWSIDGTATIVKTSTVGMGVIDGAISWVRVTLDVDNGAGGNDVKFYTSVDGVTWTQLGATVTTAGVTSIFDSTAVLELGSQASGGSNRLAGKVYHAEVRNGIDGPIVAKFDPSAIAKTGTRLPTTTVQPGGTPNLLTPNQASIETDTSGYVSGTNSPTLARDTVDFLDGVASISLTATAAGPTGMNAIGSVPRFPVVAGKLYTAKLSSKAATIARTSGIQINWYTAVPTYISTSTGTIPLNSTSAWTEAVITAVAPPGAVFGEISLYLPSAAGVLSGEVHKFDRMSVVEAAEVWTLNGSAWDHVNVPQLPTKGRVLEFV